MKYNKITVNAVIILILSILALPLSGAVEGKASAQIDIPLKLNGPVVYKVDWQDQLLTVGDLNGDEINDFLTVNNAKSILTLYLSNEEVDSSDGPFEKQEVVMEKYVLCAKVADINRDGRNDILLSGTPERLEVMLQDKDGKIAPPDERDVECQSFLLDDESRRNATILFYAFMDNTITLYKVDKSGRFQETAVYNGTGKPRGNPQLLDIDGDGVKDLFFADSIKSNRIIVRMRDKDGLLLPEQNYETGVLVSGSTMNRWGEQSAILGIEGKTRVLKVFQYKEQPQDSSPVTLSTPYLIGFDPENQSSSTFIEIGDFNSDGNQDILLASPGAGNIRICYASDNLFDVKKFPAYSGIVKAQYIPPMSRKDTAWIAIVSKTEKVIAFSRCHEDNRIDFPQPVTFDVEPISFEIADIDGSGKSDFLLLAKNVEGKADLRIYYDQHPTKLNTDEFVTVSLSRGIEGDVEKKDENTNGDDLFGSSENSSTDELPVDIRSMDLNGDKRDDLLLFYEFDKPLVLFQTEDKKFQSIEIPKSVEEGIFKTITPDRVISSPLSQTDGEWVFFARKNFLRAFRLDENNAPVIYQQFNGKNNNSTIERAVVLDLNADGESEIAMLDTYNKILTIYLYKEGEWEIAKNLSLEEAGFINLAATDLNGDGSDDVILLAADRLMVMLSNVPSHEMKTMLTLKSDVDDGYYALVECGNLLPDTKVESIILLENTEHLLEFFDLVDGEEDLTRIFRFKSFSGEEEKRAADTSGGQFSAPQPREILIDDFNNDGINDLICLIHNKVLLYYQEK